MKQKIIQTIGIILLLISVASVVIKARINLNEKNAAKRVVVQILPQ